MSIEIKITARPEDGDMANQLHNAFLALGYLKKDKKEKEPEAKVSKVTLDWQPVENIEQAVALVTETKTEHEEKIPKEPIQFTPAEIPESKRKRKSKAEVEKEEKFQRQISTGAERTNPEEDAIQDAKDEVIIADTLFTIDDVRKLIGDYSKIHGIAKAATEVPLLLGCKIHELSDDQVSLANAIAVMRHAINPDAPQARIIPVSAQTFPDDVTKADVGKALMAYAAMYDGVDIPLEQMHATLEDGPKMLMKIFGSSVTNISAIPADPISYAKAKAAIEAAIIHNPYKREAKNG